MNAASMAKLSTEMDGLRSRTDALSSTLQSYVLQIGKVDAAKFNGEDKKRALDLINKAMNGTAEEAVKAAAELKALGETNPSFANAFNRMAAVAEQLGRLREAFRLANQEFSGIEAKVAADGATRRQRKDQSDLEGAGFKLDLSVPNAQQDPVLEGIRLQAREREAALSDSAKRVKALTKEIYEAGLKAGDGTTMAQAEATAKRIAAIEAAQKGGGGGKGPKSVEDKAEDRIKSYTDSLARQNDVLKAEIENFGKSNAQRRAAMELARAGVDLSRLDTKTREEVLGKLTAETQKHEELLVAKQKLVDAQKAVNDANRFFGDTAADALEDLIINGEKAEDVLKNVVKQLARAALQAALMGSGPLAGLFGMSGSNGAPGGLIGGLLGGLIPGRAAGGPVSAGKPYIVGEKRPELFVPSTSGRIVPKVPSGLSGGGRGAVTISPTYSIDARGSQMSEAQFRAILSENNAALKAEMPGYLGKLQQRGGT